MIRHRLLRPALCAFVAVNLVASSAAALPSLLLVLDASGSMWGQIDGENKIVIARRVLGELIGELPAEGEVGLVAYGHRREGDCADVETVVPPAPLDRAALTAAIDGLDPKGKTPITAALEQAFAALRNRGGAGTVILVSDGLETCGGDPCAAVRAARRDGVDLVLHVVGLDLEGEDLSSLECAAQAGGGLFLAADDAPSLSAAIDAAVAMAAESPAGALSVATVADGELQDATVRVVDAASGSEVAIGRTYARPSTNPRRIPLADGRYRVEVVALGIEGDVRRELDVVIAGGGEIERRVDYSTGELAIGVTRNGALSDAVYSVVVPRNGSQATRGRTYADAASNPAIARLTAGTYKVTVASVELPNRPSADLGTVTVEPGRRVELEHDFASATLIVGVERDGLAVDAVVRVIDVVNGQPVAQGRTYTDEATNPRSFVLPPGSYRLVVQEIRGPKRELRITLGRGETLEETVDPRGLDR